MLTLPIYQVDAFTSRVFGGNPAAVVLLDEWLPDETLQAIGEENNLSETAFVEPSNSPAAHFQLRWFTPTVEVRLCGHATLGAAHTLFSHQHFSGDEIKFTTLAGELIANRMSSDIQIRLPAIQLNQKPSLIDKISKALNTPVEMTYTSDVPINAEGVVIARLDSADAVAHITPDMHACLQIEGGCICVTAAGDVTSHANDQPADFVSRYFCPGAGVHEDPVTGSNHCALVPLWRSLLEQEDLIAHQCSSRGGLLKCKQDGNTILLRGSAADYLKGEITVPE